MLFYINKIETTSKLITDDYKMQKKTAGSSCIMFEQSILNIYESNKDHKKIGNNHDIIFYRHSLSLTLY